MRKLAAAGVLLATCTLAVAQENAASTDPAPPPGGNWLTRMWSSGDKKETTKAPAADKKKSPSGAELASSRLTRENVILNRRNQVILKLREIAQTTHDDELSRKADELQQRAWEVYLQKTDSLGGADRRGEDVP